MQLRRGSGDAPVCAECDVKEPVGPCAACESMICGDCGVLTKDPAGTRCICTSCARLIATVGERPRGRARSGRASKKTVAIAIVVVAAFGLAAISGIF